MNTQHGLLARFTGTALLAATLTSGCASLPRDGASERYPTANLVTVDNRTFDQIVVYLARDGMRTRIATIPGLTERTIKLPPVLVGSGVGIQLEARALGTNLYSATDPFSTGPGEAYTWVVGASPALTYFVQR